MNLNRPNTPPVADIARQLRADELTPVGATLTDEELNAVAGARMNVSWTCGSADRADEWTV